MLSAAVPAVNGQGETKTHLASHSVVIIVAVRDVLIVVIHMLVYSPDMHVCFAYCASKSPVLLQGPTIEMENIHDI